MESNSQQKNNKNKNNSAIFSINQILLVSLFGGPLAGFLMSYFNSRVIGDKRLIRKMASWGFVLFLLYGFALYSLFVNDFGLGLPLLFAVFVCSAAILLFCLFSNRYLVNKFFKAGGVKQSMVSVIVILLTAAVVRYPFFILCIIQIFGV